MIHYFGGADREGARRAARAAFAGAQKELPTAPAFELAGESTSPENWREMAYARPLTGARAIIFFDHLLDHPMGAGFIADHLAVLVSSDNLFIFWEDGRGEELARAVVKAGGVAKEFRISTPLKPREDKKETAKLFAVADALGDKDRKRAWLLYHEVLRGGTPAEEIFWKFVWKVKTLLLVDTAPIGSAIPLKSYPLSQARRQVKSYQSGELARLSSRLVRLYHDARRGRADFDFALERLLLEL